MSETFALDTTLLFSLAMIHPDLMLIVVDELVLLDQEPLPPLLGAGPLTRLAEDTAHDVRPPRSHVRSPGH